MQGDSLFAFSRNTALTVSLFVLSNLFTGISKANYFSEMFLGNTTCFWPQGNRASHKKKGKARRNVLSGGQQAQLAVSSAGQHTFPSSVKCETAPEWSLFNQYNLFVNVTLLGGMSSKSLLKLKFHISKSRCRS